MQILKQQTAAHDSAYPSLAYLLPGEHVHTLLDFSESALTKCFRDAVAADLKLFLLHIISRPIYNVVCDVSTII